MLLFIYFTVLFMFQRPVILPKGSSKSKSSGSKEMLKDIYESSFSCLQTSGDFYVILVELL